MKICDAHVHIGPFARQLYFDASEIADCMTRHGVAQFLFFSTSYSGGFEEGYQQFLREKAKLEELYPQALPALWLPLQAFPRVSHYLLPEIRALKFHPQVEQGLRDSDYEYVMKSAADQGLPLIIHTSYDEPSSCRRIAHIAERCPETKLILAHGRPFEDCAHALEMEQVYADTAFMPLSEIENIIHKGLGHKLIFGSDYPLDKYFYPDECARNRYTVLLEQIRHLLPMEALYGNFKKLFQSAL